MIKTRNWSDIQECIPVACVPPAHWPYVIVSYARPSTTTHAPQQPHAPWQPPMPPQQPHMPPQPCMPPGNHTCPQQPCIPPLATMHVPQQPHMPPTTMHAPQQPCMPPGNHAHPPPLATTHVPPVNRMTDRCKNITLPQASSAGGNNTLGSAYMSSIRANTNL